MSAALKLPESFDVDVYDNIARSGDIPRISIVIPTFRHDASWLIQGLAACTGAHEAVEIVAYDDGSRDSNLTDRLEAVADRVDTPVRVVTSRANKGRAGARNAAIGHARADWILMLDADMAPDSLAFIGAYLDAIDASTGPALIVGGYSLKQAPSDHRFDLHRWQARTSECVPAAARARAPGRYVFSSNVLAHRDVLTACPFDEAFAGWGWEDTDWGLRCETSFPILHIDNTATHLGLDHVEALMSKYARSGANFALLASRHPNAVAATPLHRAACVAKRLPFRSALTSTTRKIASSDRLPVAVRGHALKAWRALVYAETV